MKNYCTRCHQADDYMPPEISNRVRARQTLVCPSCRREVVLVSIPLAAKIVSRSRKTIYDWMEKGRISFELDAANRRLIWYSSLFHPSSDSHRDSEESRDD